ncbi:kinase-like protein [Armillaria solidipes]|uniref:Kinase-like protein n=1 Tax=Armillaria solidipes TaxID=1076256 RepID=A0A2H3AP75_9AGAR|nr:kinase-like protein [Armillaria solidipes]
MSARQAWNTKCADENQGDEAILDMLLDRPSSEPEHGMNTSINNVVEQVIEALSKSNIHHELLGLSIEEAQCTLDFLQDLLDGTSLPMISKRALLKTALKLTRIHDCVPRCLMLKGFKKTGDHPFAQGHFGELWRGQVGGMEVAVKQARIFAVDNNILKVLRQVRREAIIWRQCDHPNVLPFYGIYRGSAPSTYCLVSPFMVNGSLRQYMNKTDDPDRHNLALDITRGMNYLHTLSIVHGDLKGDNILIADDCRAVIADFGISFVMGGTTFATSPSSSRNGGTVRWQAPEVLSNSPNSFPADVYSLTCVYFEVFDGAIPWSGLNDGAVIINVIVKKRHPPYPKHLESTGHAELWREVMTKCWSHEPQDRPTLLDIVQSLHMTEDMPMTESKWDRSVPTRLRDPLVQIPSGLPRLFNLEGLANAHARGSSTSRGPRHDGPSGEKILPPIPAYNRDRHTPGTSSNGHHTSDKGRPTFGIDLAEQMTRDDVEIPPIMRKCCEAIEKYGMDVSGIYLRSERTSKVQNLKHQLDKDLDSVDLDAPEWSENIHNVTGVLKMWLRELPDPLMTVSLQHGFIEAAKIDDDLLRYIRLHERVNDLPDANYATLKYFLGHLHRLIQEPADMMTVRNMSIILGPTLFGQILPAVSVNGGMNDAGASIIDLSNLVRIQFWTYFVVLTNI